MNKINENYEFARFLKMNADDLELDRQFKSLHDKYFANYDCSRCRKCCKKLAATFTGEELESAAKKQNYPLKDFIKIYFEKDPIDNTYHTKRKPCPFLKNNKCILEENKPKSCTEYPYTNKPERLFSMYTIVSNAEICPVVNKILESLKEIYNFKTR